MLIVTYLKRKFSLTKGRKVIGGSKLRSEIGASDLQAVVGAGLCPAQGYLLHNRLEKYGILKQRCAIKFSVKLDENEPETLKWFRKPTVKKRQTVM